MRRRVWWVVAALVIVGAPIAWYLGSPLFISKTVNEPFPTTESTGGGALPMSKNATVPAGMTREQVEDMMMKAARVTATTAEPVPAAASPGNIAARGTLVAADNFHKGEGTATVYRVGGTLLLRLDPFKVTNGPDLRVILTRQPAPTSRTDVEKGYVEVARLKGNIGAQNYSWPAGARLDDYHAVAIYCKMFHVIFSTATLERPQP